jgi:agmatine/peptidylarginine deiminase
MRTAAALRGRFGFNGWGGKYDDMEGDREVGESLARAAGLEVEFSDWVLEGGAIDTDGTGLVVTTEECLLNPNRNPHLSKADIEERLAATSASTGCCGSAARLFVPSSASRLPTTSRCGTLARLCSRTL